MQLRACPAQGKSGCGSCDGHPTLRDRRGAEFPLLCRARQYTTLLNPIPLYLADKPIRGMDFVTLYFTTETPAQCRAVYEAFLRHEPPQTERTNGLYFREWK